MSSSRSSTFRSVGSRRSNGHSEAGQAALAIILGIVLVMVTVPLVADLLITGQQAVVQTSQNQQQALQAAQAGLVDFDNHVAVNPYYAAAPPLGYCSANGTGANSFIDLSTLQEIRKCASGTTDPNDPGFSNAFDPNCTTSSAIAPLTTPPAAYTYGWDLLSGSKSAGSLNAEYQFVVDSRDVTSTTIAAGTATAYVFVTGRSGSSGHYACRSIKAAVNVLNPNSTTSTTLSTWLPPTVSPPPPPPTTGYQTVTFNIVGGSGAAGGAGFLVKGGTGGFAGTATGTFVFPNDFPGTTTPIYFGYQVGLAGSLKPKSGNGGGTGYAAGGAAGGDSGGGGGATAFCIMPSTSISQGTCLSTWPVCPSITSFVSGSIPTGGCILSIAAGGGGGGEANFLLKAGNGGNGGQAPTSGTPGQDLIGLTLNNGGKAATSSAAGVGGNGGWLIFPTKNGGNGSGPGTGTGGYGATYGLGNDGGGGGAGYWGGGGGGAGLLIDGGGGGGGGFSWSLPTTGTWDNYLPTGGAGGPVTVGYGTAPTAGNGKGSISVTTQSAQAVTTTYPTTCSGTTQNGPQTAAAPTLAGATWTSVNVVLAGGGGGGGAVPPEKSTQPYSEPGGVGGYIGGTNGSANGQVTINISGSGSTTAPTLTYETGCGGGAGAAAATASTVASGDNAKTLAQVATAGVLDVASSTSFIAAGRVSVVASGGTAVLAYTGVGTGTLTGVTVVSGTTTWTLATNNVVTQVTTVAAGDNGVALSALAGTLDVASSTGFNTAGQVSVVASGGTAVLAYTGTGTGTLTGVTIVSGTATWTLATNNAVTQLASAGAGGQGFGTGGSGGVGTNTGTAANGGKAASGAGGGASVSVPRHDLQWQPCELRDGSFDCDWLCTRQLRVAAEAAPKALRTGRALLLPVPVGQAGEAEQTGLARRDRTNQAHCGPTTITRGTGRETALFLPISAEAAGLRTQLPQSATRTATALRVARRPAQVGLQGAEARKRWPVAADRAQAVVRAAQRATHRPVERARTRAANPEAAEAVAATQVVALVVAERAADTAAAVAVLSSTDIPTTRALPATRAQRSLTQEARRRRSASRRPPRHSYPPCRLSVAPDLRRQALVPPAPAECRC